MRTIVFFMISMVMIDSVDPPDRTRTIKKGDPATHITFVDKAVFEHSEGDKESRTSSTTDAYLYRHPIAGIDFLNRPYVLVKFNSPNATSLFKSIPSDLPSPPPKV